MQGKLPGPTLTTVEDETYKFRVCISPAFENLFSSFLIWAETGLNQTIIGPWCYIECILTYVFQKLMVEGKSIFLRIIKTCWCGAIYDH